MKIYIFWGVIPKGLRGHYERLQDRMHQEKHATNEDEHFYIVSSQGA